MTIPRSDLNQFYSELLAPEQFKDYCPNGLQIEGCEQINKIAFAVSASRDSIQQAIAKKAQALVVHHGLFWKFHGARCLTGPFARRVFPLVQHNINLFAYHLPLDAHPEFGNAATLGKYIGLEQQLPFGLYQGCPTGVKGKLSNPLSGTALKVALETLLDHKVILASENPQQLIHSVGIITGGANSEWREAATQGLDAYITGEISEHDWHESQEAGIQMFAGGHHATEKFGIQALMQGTASHFGIECIYIDSQNPA